MPRKFADDALLDVHEKKKRKNVGLYGLEQYSFAIDVKNDYVAQEYHLYLVHQEIDI